MNFLASVQTSADTAPVTFGLVLTAIACMALLALLVAAPELVRAWWKGRSR